MLVGSREAGVVGAVGEGCGEGARELCSKRADIVLVRSREVGVVLVRGG